MASVQTHKERVVSRCGQRTIGAQAGRAARNGRTSMCEPEDVIMEREIINPWKWQDQYGFVQANEVSGARRVLYCAGQVSVDADGNPLNAGDMRAQITQALDNVEAVL